MYNVFIYRNNNTGINVCFKKNEYLRTLEVYRLSYTAALNINTHSVTLDNVGASYEVLMRF